MAINRIEDIRLTDKHLFTGIFGSGIEDVFIDEDLRVYGICEALYISLKRDGYTVVFYSQDPSRNFYSYRKEDLAILYNLRKSSGRDSVTHPSGQRRYVAKIKSPFGRRRTANAENNEENGNRNAGRDNHEGDEPEYDQIQTPESAQRDCYYRIADSVDPFKTVTDFITRHPERKIAFIFTTGLSDKYTEQQVTQIDAVFESLRRSFSSTGLGARILVMYDCVSCNQIFKYGDDTFFTSKQFKNQFIDVPTNGDDDNSAKPTCSLIEISGPDRDEFRNLLNRRRLKENLELFSLPGSIDKICIRLVQESYMVNTKKGNVSTHTNRLSHYLQMPKNDLQEMIKKFDNDSAWDRLHSLKGMEGVISQLENYIETLRYSQNNSESVRFRPHLVFSGNPGTGKTTVARLLADILREENLLERGHLIEATVGDLIGQYVGETRIKTQALCDRARGGVLFIDEAYGLMSGSNHGDNVDFGKEAIEVLIQFMENYSDSLVILGGYKDDMKNLIQNGNQGFMRRFNGKESFIQFEDYSPDALYSIFQRNIEKFKTDEEFDAMIKQIINYQYYRRTIRWGNAGEMEKLASSIESAHRRNGGDGVLKVENIPQNYVRLVTPVESIDEILKEIDDLVGLKEVKEKLRKLLKSAMGQRKLALRDGHVSADQMNLNFIFTGAPGTGKTTVANLMAKILYSAGIIDNSDKALTVQKSDIIKSGVGDTPKAIKKLFTDYAGEVIFIDEAYGLTEHGTEAIDEITNCLTDPRFMGNQAVILAGYTKEMNDMISSNPGLESRFENIWFFEDYSDDDLWTIFMKLVAGKRMQLEDPDKCKALAYAYFDEKRRNLGPKFSNARQANQLFNGVCESYYVRAYTDDIKERIISPIDFPNYK